MTKKERHIYKERLPEKEEDDVLDDKVILKPVVGIFGAISFIVGSIIGTGIFLSPTGVLDGVSGSVGWSLIVWVVCALIAACGAYCFVELGTIFRKSGGEFTFLDEVYGPMVGYVRAWIMFFMGGPVWSSLQCIVIASYVTTPFFGPCTEAPYPAVRLLSICVFMVTLAVNGFSTTLATRFQIFYTIAKNIGLAVIIVSGIVMLCLGETQNFQQPFQAQTEFSFSKLPGAFYAGLFAYSGWSFVIYIIEEVENPRKILPKAMNISLTLVTVVYLLANISYMIVLKPTEILASDAVAATYAVRILHSWSWTVWVFVAISAAGTLNSGVYSRTRMSFVASREGRFPQVLSLIHIRHRTPLVSLLLPIPITLFMLCWANVWFLINFMGFVEVIFQTMAYVIIPYVRWRQPEREIPFKTHISLSLVAIAANVFLMIITIISVPIDCVIGICFIAAAVGVYFIDKKLSSDPEKYSWLTDKINIFVQKLFFSIPQEEKTY